jgi:hypothetical protein
MLACLLAIWYANITNAKPGGAKMFQRTKEGQKIKKHIEKNHCLKVTKLKKINNTLYCFYNNGKLFNFDKMNDEIY